MVDGGMGDLGRHHPVREQFRLSWRLAGEQAVRDDLNFWRCFNWRLREEEQSGVAVATLLQLLLG
jgi:hypothetical protein